ncbi:hypothetical protein D9M69_668890 [compost metagenome]
MVAFLERGIGIGVEGGEVAGCNVKFFCIVRADAEQFVLADRARQPQHVAVQTGTTKGPVELDGVLADQRHQHRISLALTRRVESR